MIVEAVVPATTGGQAQQQFARMKARLVARYRLSAVPGRPEELIRSGTDRGVSLGYGCKTIRVRLMSHRYWVDAMDFQIREGWTNDLVGFCDRHFGYVAPDQVFGEQRFPQL